MIALFAVAIIIAIGFFSAAIVSYRIGYRAGLHKAGVITGKDAQKFTSQEAVMTEDGLGGRIGTMYRDRYFQGTDPVPRWDNRTKEYSDMGVTNDSV